MNGKRITIYHIAQALSMSASYVSRALNNHPSVNEKIRLLVKQKAAELNYRQNLQAANLRQGLSKTIGVIVPHINQSFFSEAIAGIEEACAEHQHSLIICQSHEQYRQECKAIETLIHQNVDCILISISAETQSPELLQEILNHHIYLVQFDRCLEEVSGYKVVNDNREASYKAVEKLIASGYRRIAFIGGPPHLHTFRERKEGYLKAIQEAALDIPYHFITDGLLSKEHAMEKSTMLLGQAAPPDAFFTVSDHQSLGVLQVAKSMGLRMPEQLGIFGFANEVFAELIEPTLSSVDQKSKELGKHAANIYFKKILHQPNGQPVSGKEVIHSEIIIRQSSAPSPPSPDF